jgi:hypothetical protein
VSAPGNPPSRARRTWRDLSLVAVVCLAFASPWIIGEFASTSPSNAPSPLVLAALKAFVPQPPHDEIERQTVAVAQQGLRELLQARDSSAPPPVFDPDRVRVEHAATDIWNVSGVVTTVWQNLMASPHLYHVEIYRICHLVDPSCFKARGVALDTNGLVDSGAKGPPGP